MDVRCEKCSALYDLDEARIPPDGLAVKCSSCGHIFRARRVVVAPSPSGTDLLIRQQSGATVRAPDMAILQRWIIERRLSPDDELSVAGQAWRRLGGLADLAPFFAAIGAPPSFAPPPAVATPGPLPSTSPDTAGQGPLGAARRESTPQPLPRFLTGGMQPPGGESAASEAPGAARYGSPDAWRAPNSGHDRHGGLDPDDDDDLGFRPRRSHGTLIALVIVGLVGAGVAATLLLQGDLRERLFGFHPSDLLVQQLQSANVELKRDSYTAIEQARSMFEKILETEPRYAAAKAGLAQAELDRAEYLAEEIDELETKGATAAAATGALAPTAGRTAPAAGATAATTPSTPLPDSPAPPDGPDAIEKRKKEFQERVDHAFADAKSAVELDPDGIDGLRAMADYYRIMKAPQSMKSLLEQARLKAPNDPFLAYVAGASVASDAAMTERAIRYFDEALEAAPDMVRARYRLARLFQVQANSPQALLHVEAILKAVPDHERARVLLAELNPPPPPPPPPAAATPAEPPKEKEPSYQQLFAQAERLREADKPKQAIKLYERALEEQPSDPDAFTGIGWCYFDLEAYDAAIQNFKRALDLVPNFSDAHFGIAEAYRLKGLKRDAARHYRAYLDILPEGDDAELAKRMLNELQQ